jgi:hypothetical protein
MFAVSGMIFIRAKTSLGDKQHGKTQDQGSTIDSEHD